MRAYVYLGLLAAAAVIGCAGNAETTSTTGSGTDQFALAKQRVARLGYATVLYTADSDDILPLGPNWMDAIEPYLPASSQNQDAFRSPAVAAPGYGFAFNASAAGFSIHALPEHTVTVFDSNFTDRNSYAFLSSLPSPPRYAEGNAESTIDQTNPDVPATTGIDGSLSRVRQALTAQSLYANDHDDKLPPSGRWMDVYKPYAGNSDTPFISPIFDGTGSFGFALSSALPGTSLVDFGTPATTIAIFDSTLTSRNAEGTEATLPNPGRYSGQNAVGFLDGHAEAKTIP